VHHLNKVSFFHFFVDDKAIFIYCVLIVVFMYMFNYLFLVSDASVFEDVVVQSVTVDSHMYLELYWYGMSVVSFMIIAQRRYRMWP